MPRSPVLSSKRPGCQVAGHVSVTFLASSTSFTPLVHIGSKLCVRLAGDAAERHCMLWRRERVTMTQPIQEAQRSQGKNGCRHVLSIVVASILGGLTSTRRPRMTLQSIGGVHNARELK